MKAINSHDDIDIVVNNILEKHFKNKNECSEYNIVLKILKKALGKTDRILFLIPALFANIENVKTESPHFIELIQDIKKLSHSVSLMVNPDGEDKVDLNFIKEMYSFVRLSLFIDRRSCSNDISDSLLRQIHNNIYSEYYLETMLIDCE